MFTIIGGDGKEYGPATAEQLRSWITAGRANLETKAKLAGETEFRRLGDFPEFGGTAAPAEPPPLTGNFDPAPAFAPVAPSTEDPGAGADPTPLAGRGARTGAALINAFFYFLAMMPGGGYVALHLLREHPEVARGVPLNPADIDLEAMAPFAVWIYVGLGAAMLIQCVLLTRRGQNLGKMIFGVRVVGARDGAPAGFVRGAVARFVMPAVLFILLNGFYSIGTVLLLIDYAFIFRADRRCLHDLLADTKVVKA